MNRIFEGCRNSISIKIDTPQSVNSTFGKRLTDELLGLPHLSRLEIGLDRIYDGTTLTKAEGEIRELVNNLGEFHNLEALHFFGLLLENVPAGIEGLKALSSLRLVGAGLREVPNWIGDLRRLRQLWLSLNELDVLPASLAKLTDLDTIRLSENRFTEIPEALFQLGNLINLDVSCLHWRG